MIRACVIGYPISHSRSPVVHRYWLEKYNINGEYGSEAVHPDELASFLGSIAARGYAGCNVTVPHKEAACAHVDEPDACVKQVGSLNTIYIRNGKLCATSTDGEGFVANVKWQVPGFSFGGKSIAIIGAGGSTRAVVAALLRENVSSISVVNRTIEKAAQLQQAFGPKISAWGLQSLPEVVAGCDFLINTTSAGIADDQSLDVPVHLLKSHAVVSDINYVPLQTELVRRAEERGLRVVSGLGMLLHQAVRGFELWFGVRPEVTNRLFDLVARDIDPSYRR